MSFSTLASEVFSSQVNSNKCSYKLRLDLQSFSRSPRHNHRCRNLSNLTDSQRFTPSHIVVAGGLWNCQSAVQKADFISALASFHFLHFLALTETWITLENLVTLEALSSAFSFTHSPRHLSRGGGTGLLMSREWCFTPLSFSTLSISSFEFHAITVSFPTKLLIIVIYHPPGSLDHFIGELNILLSQFPIEGNPLMLLGVFNLPSDKLHSFCILPLLTAFDLTLNHSPLTHKAGNVLDLIFNWTTTPSDIAVTPLHLSDHHFLSFSLTLPSLSIQSSPTCSSFLRRNLHSITPSSLTSTILSTLPHPDSLSCLSLDTVTNTFISTLSSSMNLLCPLSSRPAKSSPTAPWLTETLRCHKRELRTAERWWRKSHVDSDLSSNKSLLSKFSLEVRSAKSSYYRENFKSSASDPRKLFTIFPSLLNPSPPPPSSSLTPEDFITFFDEKVAAIRQSFSSVPTPPTNGHSPTSNSLTSFSPLSRDEILLTSSNPTTCLLDPIPSAMFQTIKQVHDPNLSGYRPAHSTETALIVVTEKLHAARAAKQSSVLILLDLSAAFDTVNHNILLSVLSRLGVTGSAWRWFQSYLDGRSYQLATSYLTLTDEP
ncbi:hypothetical protein P4O66_003102 [Electrophorus voltai]|uniref:Reverse transcriptase domain-containing protein n=1 Tax=Electrophorus voltai TaxID=2609070 RepID=A0AAD8YSZ2_9TELE|nr:hypothetical protein P4O66_003102 [Electrophorus voltai]